MNACPQNYVYGNYLRGLEYLQRGDSTNALDFLRKALRIDNRDYRVWLGLGDWYTTKKEYDKAVIHYTQALNLFPQCTVGICRLAQALLWAKNGVAAQKMITKGLSLDRENPGVVTCYFLYL